MTKKQKKLLYRAIAAAGAFLAAYLVTEYVEMPWWAQLIVFFVPYGIIGCDIVFGAIRNVFHGQFLDEKFLMMFATIGAFVVGEYPEAVEVMLFYQVGELFQSIAVGKSRKSIQSLMEICPEKATVLRDGVETDVDPAEVEVGEIVVVRPGEKIPLDGVITEGTCFVSTVALTGESAPQSKTVGDEVYGGSIDSDSLIYIRVTAAYDSGTVAKVLETVENAAEKKAKSERFITRFSRYYTPVVVGTAFVLALIPPLFMGIGAWEVWRTWIYRAMTFLVVSCPCALVISVPLSFFGGIGSAARRGILVKGATDLENLAKVKTFVFDKTGTLTDGEFAVTAIHPHKMSEEELLDVAALAESHSTHPIAESIEHAHKGHLDIKRVTKVTEHPGLGVEAVIDGKVVYVGNARYMDEKGIVCHECDHCHACHAGTVVHIAHENECLGHITVSDIVKEDAQSAISDLKKAGALSTVMLTGDKEEMAREVAMETGVDECVWALLPQGKVKETEKRMDGKNKVAFVGDGINDAPVIMRADVGIAMGAMGSDAAIEAADVVIMDDKPSKIATAFSISKKTMRIVYENIVGAIGIKILVLILAAFGLAGMWLAVFADVGVCVLAILNALRCLRAAPQKKRRAA